MPCIRIIEAWWHRPDEGVIFALGKCSINWYLSRFYTFLHSLIVIQCSIVLFIRPFFSLSNGIRRGCFRLCFWSFFIWFSRQTQTFNYICYVFIKSSMHMAICWPLKGIIHFNFDLLYLNSAVMACDWMNAIHFLVHNAAIVRRDRLDSMVDSVDTNLFRKFISENPSEWMIDR